MKKSLVLIILDGWGISKEKNGNAIASAKIPFYNSLLNKFPNTNLLASGEAVGLPHQEVGNTETGHLNIGAGYIVYQDLPRINMSIADGSFEKNQAFLSAISHVNKYNSTLHLLGLIGSGGVHSNIEHLYALLTIAEQHKLNKVVLHLFTDGRDSPPTSSKIYVQQIINYLNLHKIGKIGSIGGRYYALDRDNHWERTKLAYEALTQGKGYTAASPLEAIQKAYERGETDEFIKPTLILDDQGKNNLVSDNDSLIFFNFRIDRPRQLTKSFIMPDLKQAAQRTSFDPYSIKYYKKHFIPADQDIEVFERGQLLKNLFFVTMTQYEDEIPAVCAFPPEKIKMPLGKVLSLAGKKQLHLAESEKERFITYYFNGYRNDPFLGEDDVIIPSPRISTYDLKPEMSSFEITENLLMRMDSQIYDFIVVNFACPDMVAHTGVLDAGIKAVETVDKCLEKIINKAFEIGSSCIITGDHGNAEEMINKETNDIDTEHSNYPVPFILVGKEFSSQILSPGILADIAPTCLALLDIPKPLEMSGRNLLENYHI